MAFSLLSVPTILFALAACVLGEKHTVTFENNWDMELPTYPGTKVLSTGEPYTSDGPLYSVIAYLQTGDCGYDGIGCSLVETSLINPKCPGCGSSSDISLIPPLAYSVPVDFTYYGGCNGLGATCSSADCETAFFDPDDNEVQVACQDDDVNLKITFCPNGTTGFHTTALPSAYVSRRIPRVKRTPN
ncbi:glycopeptide [Cyathus striatus]|nr:glycopeptide [Cyathus striatus]